MPAIEQVILVDEYDTVLGAEEKIAAHQEDKLHRAISVFVFNSMGQMLVQQRAFDKYHSGGLWSNTCCSHPRPGEATEVAAHRRLQEEMGFDCPLTYGFGFTYRVELAPGFYENEYDHVLIGQFDGVLQPNPAEVAGYRWMSPLDVLKEMDQQPKHYTYWFQLILQRVLDHTPQVLDVRLD
jgi:isopentenyl-diphosphate delta-isomerase